MNNYVIGRNREIARLAWLRKKRIAIIGGRFRGSKISKGWIRSLGFNPKLDLWYIDANHVIHFEQFKSAAKGRRARISNNEVRGIKLFADIFHNSPRVWVGFVLKDYRKAAKEVRLN